MLESIQSTYERLLSEVSTSQYRFLYPMFNFANRLVGLVGPRGVGKTTLMLQYIKNHFRNSAEAFYFSADHIYFDSTTVYQFVEQLYLEQNIKIFFIDEIHKYKSWSQELKNLYDSFPKIQIAFSGSSSLDLVKGSYDLSRRAKMYYLPGLSFREYLNFTYKQNYPPITLNELMANSVELNRKFSTLPGLLGDYQKYLQHGFYPFFQDDPLSYHEKLLTIIEKTIFEDITNFYNLKTENLRYFGKILNFLASVPPGNVSTYNLGKNLGINDKTAASYLQILSETGLVEIIYSAASGNRGLRKPEKVFLNNTNLYYALAGKIASQIEIGTIRELAFIQAIKNSAQEVFYDKKADYQIQQYTFEIGGKNKTKKQIQDLENAFLVKEGIVSAIKGTIPLVYFGFLY